MKENYNKSVKKTDQEFIADCKKNGVLIFKIQHVITWEQWDDGIGVYIFTKTNKELNGLSKTDIKNLKTEYLSGLKRNNYPFDKFPNIVFEFDSHQNVQENYEGSYFYRLR
ncbi:hypothetical protein [Nonlabens ulvanivorans]|uniref:hypothetical protein n=2 Tax=Flavobacteriales TaxID=200644 RepID=UPI003264C5FC